jgi:two-component system chemotaxis sensor kinase CheA
MDVVRRNAEALRGSVSVWSEPQKGTAVTLRLPLTLALIQGFRVAVGEETYIVPLEAVLECVELPAGERGAGAAAGIFDLRGHPLPFLRLRRHFRTAPPAPRRENLVVVQHGGSTAGLAVDALLGECQTVVKPLGPMMQGLSGISGSSIMGDGRVALILDVGSLLREALKDVAPQA